MLLYQTVPRPKHLKKEKLTMASGHQTGGRVNFIAGSSSMSNLEMIIMFKIFMICHHIKKQLTRVICHVLGV